MNKLFLNRKGSALVYVMFSLVFILLMISVMMSITLSNTKMASEQESGMQAYYIARSGVEAGYEAILTTDLLVQFKNNTITEIAPSSIDFGEGTAVVKATSTGSGINQKILIESTGTMKGSGVSRNVTLEFYADFEKNASMVWSK